MPGKNGFLVPVKDENLLFEAMLKACAISPEQRSAMGVFGREKAEKQYGTAQIGQVYRLLVREILEKT